MALFEGASPAAALVLIGKATGTISNMVDGNGVFGSGPLFGKPIEVRFRVDTGTPDILFQNTDAVASVAGGDLFNSESLAGRPVTAEVIVNGFVHDVINSSQSEYEQRSSLGKHFLSSVFLVVTNNVFSDSFDYIELGATDHSVLPKTAKFGTPIDFTKAVDPYLNISFHRGFQTIEARDIHLVVNAVSGVPEPGSGMGLIAGLGVLGCALFLGKRSRPPQR